MNILLWILVVILLIDDYLLMVINEYSIVDIGCYSINWWLFYEWLLMNILLWILVVILLMDIDEYFINVYSWILYCGHWLLFY
jgi:hypothetical protein